MLNKEKELKILLFDIETAPTIAAVWGVWEQNAVWVEQDWYMLSFAYKWLGDKDVQVEVNRSGKNDKALAKKLRSLFDEADVLIAHNGDEFDIKKANARFVVHGLVPPSPYLSIDTKKVAKKYFKFDSNSLNDLARYFNIGSKKSTGGATLWRECIAGDDKAWAKMVEYNAQDVVLLEKIYLRMRPYMRTHPAQSREVTICPKCGSSKCQRRGMERTVSGLQYQRYQCVDCGGWHRDRIST